MVNQRETLLDILQAAHLAPDDYRSLARAWLEREIGFDGYVWGSGRRSAEGSIAIDSAELGGRPPALLAGYAEVAGLDPVSRRFGAEPRRLQNVAVARDYRSRAVQPVAAYLRDHHVAHLMLCGVRCSPEGQMAWLTLYREDVERPFSAEDAGQAAFALPFVLLGERRAGSGSEAAGEGPTRLAGLTPREYEVAEAYAGGGDYKSVARTLDLSPATVRSHLLSIFRKLSVHNKIELRRRMMGER